MADPVIVLEHLRRLTETHGQKVVADRLGVSQPYLSRILKPGPNQKPLAGKLAKKLLDAFPLSAKQESVGVPAAVARPTPTRLGDDDEGVWLTDSRRRGIEAFARAEAARDRLDEAEWLALRPEYQEVRSWLLELAPDLNLEEVLEAPPVEGPSQVIAEVRTELEDILSQSVRRESCLSDDDKGKLALSHTNIRASTRRHLAKIARQAPLDDLMKSEAWKLTKLALAASFRLDDALRVAAVESLRKLDSDLSNDLAASLDAVRSLTFPCPEYQNDPVGFIRRVIGRDPWEIESTHWRTGEPIVVGQTVIAYSVRDNKWTVVHTGHKIGKTAVIAWINLWWYCVWEDGRGMLTNFTGNQLETQDWLEITIAFNESGICLDCRNAGVTARPCPHSQCIDGFLHSTSLKGLVSDNGKRFIKGVTPKDATGSGGYSGAHLLVTIDEFSGMSQEIFDGWISNTSSRGSRFLGVGNPIGQEGPMYDAVMIERISKDFNVINMSSEDAARTGIAGLADADHIERVASRDERGRDSPFFMIRIRGLYPTRDEQSIYQMGDIVRAQEVDFWRDAPTVGRLIVSLDPAKPEGLGDKFVAAATRGKRCFEFKKGRGWSEDDCLEIMLDMATRLRSEATELVIFAVDADGPGANIIRRLSDYQASKRVPEHEKVRFEIVPVYFGHVANDQFEYDLVGDEAHKHLSHWLRHGGAFPVDHELEQEMQHSRWYPVRRRRNERELELLSATRKDGPNGYRKLIHRSPDTLDALRIFAYAAFMRETLDAPSLVPPKAKEDAEQQVVAKPVDERAAYRKYIQALRSGRTC